MKKIFVMLALTMGVVSANAQSVDSTAVTNTVADDVTLTTDIYPQQEDGDIYHGLTKKLTFDRMIPPCWQGRWLGECDSCEGYSQELPR